MPYELINTPIAKLGLTTADNSIVKLEFVWHDQPLTARLTQLALQTRQQLIAYFNQPNYHFKLPIKLQGTSFQQRVWQALSNIPVGTTKTYGELAAELNSGARAIGNACRANPITIIIPCHRVTAKNNLGGYAGQQAGKLLAIKQFLLAHEQKIL